jgi:hypothetical protein
VALALAGSPTGALVALTGLQFFSSFAITPSSALTQMVAPRRCARASRRY